MRFGSRSDKRYAEMRVLMVLAAVGALAGAAHAAPALDKPAFTATPAELLAAAKALPAGSGDVVLLRDDTDISYDDRGRATWTWRLVFFVATKNGADNWDVLTSTWLPAFQDKPKIRARVIDANGRSVDLDQSLVTDAPSNDAAQAAPSDRRQFEAPLPRLTVGCIVEEQIVVVDRDSIPGGGSAMIVDVGASLPLHSARVRVSAAKKLRTIAHALPGGAKVKTETVGGRQVVTYSGNALPAHDDYPGYVPADVRPFPRVVVTPVASWNAVAKEYRALVDKRIGEGNISLPADIGKSATIGTVRAVQSWLHRQVQYTDVGFGDSSFVPSTPAESLKRGTADSKDMATLLLAALRQAGIRANLALVNIGPGPDIDRDVPGINLFDHVLVRAQLGKTEVWIDPATRVTPPGRLPWYDQARFALIVSDDATALVSTPVSKASDNVIREVRTFELAEAGGAKITEVSREGGVFEAEQRSWLRDTPADGVRKNLVDYMDDQFKAKYVSHSSTSIDDLERPFEVTVVGNDSSRAYADREAIDIYLFATDTLKKLPEVLGAPKPDEPRRKYDFNVSTPHIYEIENRFVVPAGYTMPAPAPEKTRTLGVFKLVEKQRVDGQSFVVTVRFETSKTRLTPADVTAVQQAVRELRKEDAEHIVVPLAATTLADKGQYRDAIAEVNKLIKLHPKEALHYQQLSLVLVKAGAGEAARRAARKATELEPSNADTYVVLAWVLQHDTFCQWLGFNHDRAAARTALEKARKLDPKHVGAANDLAELLERNPQGRRFDTGADVRGAIAAWRAARELDDNEERAHSLATALVWAGDGAEAEKVLRAMAAGEARDQLLIVAVALASGPDAALRTATSLASGSTRTKYVTGAGSVLFLMRRYDLMRPLFADSKFAQGGSQQDQALQRLKRSDKPFKPGKTPQDAVIDMMLVELVPDRVSNPYWDKTVRAEVADKERNALSFSRTDLMTAGLLEDVSRSSLQPAVEGDAGLWRVQVEHMSVRAVVYVASDRGTPKIIGTDETPLGVGRHVLRLLAKNDEKNALRLLDWLAKDLGSRQQNLNAHRFMSLWGTNLPRTRKDMELAAAVLAGKTEAARVIPILSACKPSTKDGQFSCDWTLSDLYRDSGKWAELLDHSQAWLARSSSSPVLPTAAQAYALAHLGKFDDADKLVTDALAKDRDNRLLVFTHADLAIARGQLVEAVRRMEPLTKGSSPDSGALNNVAWIKLIDGADLKGALVIGRKSVQLAKDNPHAANTVAAIEAELGELDEANEHLLMSVRANDRPKPGDADVYVHARVLEQLGYVDDAVALYRQIKRDSHGFGFTPEAWELAARRLKALGVKK
jgi:tetratricopeptide (TPR) repeat protein